MSFSSSDGQLSAHASTIGAATSRNNVPVKGRKGRPVSAEALPTLQIPESPVDQDPNDGTTHAYNHNVAFMASPQRVAVMVGRSCCSPPRATKYSDM